MIDNTGCVGVYSVSLPFLMIPLSTGAKLDNSDKEVG